MAKIAENFQKECCEHPDLFISAMTDAVPHPIVVRDMDSRIVFVNAAAEGFYGEDPIGRPCHEFERTCPSDCEDCAVRQVMETRQPARREVRHERTGYHLEIDVYPMFGPDGHMCGTIEVSRNVTDAHDAMEKVQSLLRQVKVQNESLTEWRKRMGRELDIAREIQGSLLPRHPFCFRGVCFDFRYEPTGSVGGDVHDVFALDEGRYGILIADASGHGVGAAFIGVLIKMAFLSQDVNADSPKEALETVNRLLLRGVPSGQFATAFYCVYDVPRRELLFTRAGHPLPMLLRHDTGRVEKLDTEGMVLGALDDAQLEQRTTAFEPGDHLFLYTDGLTEATNPAGEFYGTQRPEKLLRENGELPHTDIMELIMQDVRRFADGVPFADDLTLIIAEAEDASAAG